MKVPLEKQVASLEPSKKLVELGLKVEGLYRWVQHIGCEGIANIGEPFVTRDNIYTLPESFKIVAPALTVAESGELLPDRVSGWSHLVISKENGMFDVDYGHSPYMGLMQSTMADAMAKMLIWLIENNHVTVEELNK